jgi:hypothetical protein
LRTIVEECHQVFDLEHGTRWLIPDSPDSRACSTEDVCIDVVLQLQPDGPIGSTLVLEYAGFTCVDLSELVVGDILKVVVVVQNLIGCLEEENDSL